MVQDILIVDDEEDIRELVSDILQDEGYQPRGAKDSVSAFNALDERLPAAVILDIWLQGSQLDGLGILEIIKRKHPHLPVIMISGHGNIETAINAIKLGAYDYIEKPFKEDRLLRLLRRAIETTRLEIENAELKTKGATDTQLVGRSSSVTSLAETILRVAPTESRVLISGEPGVGKNMVARMIYQRSKRAAGVFHVLNCANLTDEQIEKELCGAEESCDRKAKRKVGILEKAHGGTLLIDEVADLPIAVQTRLLRVLQHSKFERVGSDKSISVDVRVIATTNKDLLEEIAEGRFREDLYYRLNVVSIEVPSLKDRRDDIELLIKYFIKRCSYNLGVAPRPVDPSLIAAMEMYEWPGNVRQLKNVVEWLLIMAPGGATDPLISSMLPPEIVSQTSMKGSWDVNFDIMGLPLRQARELFEKQYLKAQLQRFNGNISKTAAFVGMERSAFHRKLKLLSIHNSD